MVEGDRAVEVVHGHEALVEAALLDRDVGPALGLRREGVEGLARNAFERRDGIRADALMRLRVELLQVHVVRPHRQHALLRERHHLGAAGDHEILHAGHHRAVAAMLALVIPDPQKRSSVTPLALVS